jgi:hypothetical protein
MKKDDLKSLSDQELAEKIQSKEAEIKSKEAESSNLEHEVRRLKGEQTLRAIPSMTDAELKQVRNSAWRFEEVENKLREVADDELRKRREAQSEKLRRGKKPSAHWPHADLTNVELIIKANECDEVSGHTEEEIKLLINELNRRTRDLRRASDRIKELLKYARPQTTEPRPLLAIEGGKK